MPRFISVILLFLGGLLCSEDYNYVVERLEKLKGDDEPDGEFLVRLTRPVRGSDRYVGNGFVIFYKDIGTDVQHTIKTSYSADGTSQFRSYPYTVQQSDYCEFMRIYYRKYGQPWIEGHTDFPNIPAEGLCPIPKGKYYVQNMSYDDIPLPSHAPRGLWKIEQRFERKGKLVGGQLIFVKITDKV